MSNRRVGGENTGLGQMAFTTGNQALRSNHGRSFPVLITVIVLFHPDDETIAFVRTLADWGYQTVLVVNAAAPPVDAELDTLGAYAVIRNASNLGLAAALNQGIDRAITAGADYIMLLDQDSRPDRDTGTNLVSLAKQFVAGGGKLGCIGPVPVDRKRPTAQILANAPRSVDGVEPMPTIISSGMVIARTAIDQAGGMWNDLFIDHIDHEWCFRARAHGLAILAAPGVPMQHNMGDDGMTVLGRYKPIHRSPVRHFYIVRNTLWIARCSFIPRKWRLVEILKLAIRMPAYLGFSSDRPATVRAMLRAVRHGVAGPAQLPRRW